jgi:hypothetical protein
MHTTMRPPETNATKPGVPLIGFGQVRHTRLAPVRNAFAYGNYFLMLPMRRLRTHGAGALACNRFAPLSFLTLTMETGAGRNVEEHWPGWTACWPTKA